MIQSSLRDNKEEIYKRKTWVFTRKEHYQANKLELKALNYLPIDTNSWLYLMNASSYLWDVAVQYRYRDIVLYTLLVFPCCTYNVNHFGLVSNGRIACVGACLGSCKHAIPRCKIWKSTRILFCIIASCHRICMKSTVYIMSLYQHVYPVNF